MLNLYYFFNLLKLLFIYIIYFINFYYLFNINRITDSNMQQLYLRGMTFCTLILDHILPNGVFGKKSPVDIVGIIRLLKTWKAHNTDNLINALMFMTAHVRDQNVLGFVKKNLWN